MTREPERQLQRPEPKEYDAHDMDVNQVFEEITNLLLADPNADLQTLLHRYPRYAAQIRQLLPAVQLLAEAGTAPADSADLSDSIVPDNELRPRVLGDYHIIRELGRGGMGVVYEAEQISLERRVALKVLPFAAVLDQRQSERFKNEAKAAGALHHTNIVPVYSVGCDRGVHYYAMQFVDGKSLAAVLGEIRQARVYRGSGGSESASVEQVATNFPSGSPVSDRRHISPTSDTTPSKANSPVHTSASADTDRDVQAMISTAPATDMPAYIRAVANFGIQAADGLEHAHLHGVIHRDIKPANLIVDDHGHLWITDFGLARLEGAAGLSMTGDLMGTLRYMSPEQALGRPGVLDQRTDIYSLGATLYELLTLQPLVCGQDREQVLKRIAFEQRLGRPRRVDRGLPRDLETIVLKSVEKNPADRYHTAQQLADDLRRFLDDKPIAARRPSVASRTVKWARRNTSLVTGVVVTLLICLSLSTILLWRAQTRTSTAYSQLQNEQYNTATATAESETNWQLARGAVDDMYTQVAEEWLEDQPHMTQVQRDLLAKAAAFYESLPLEHRDDPAVRHEAAEAHRRAGKIRSSLGQYDQAARQIEKSLSQYERLSKDCPNEMKYQKGLAAALHTLGAVLDGQGKSDQAAHAYLKSIELASQAVSGDSEGPEAARDLIITQLSLGRLYWDAKNREKALPILRGVVSRSKRLIEQFPDDSKCQRCLMLSLTTLGGVSDDAESEALIRQAIEIAHQLVITYPRQSVIQDSLAYCHDWLGALMSDRERFSEAIELTREASQIYTELVKDFPDVIHYRQELAKSQTNLATMLFRMKQLDEAEDAARQAVLTARSLVETFPKNPPCHELLIGALISHGWRLRDLRRLDDARDAFQLAIDQSYERADLVDSDARAGRALARARNDLSTVLHMMKQPEDAEREARQAVAICRDLIGRFPDDVENSKELAKALVAYVQPLLQLGRPADARDALREAIDRLDESDDILPMAYISLAGILFQTGELEVPTVL